MSMFAVNGVRIDVLSARVTHVRWAAVNPTNRSWAATPSEASVEEVARALAAGNDVRAVFDEADGTAVVGPKLKRVLYRDASAGIELDIDATNESRTLRDLPQI
ncbi:phosphatidylserine/phosphatidylglycerophosphate/cardiolipin synthase [Burkholderia ambifaria]|uniref:phosphatidylserine/phosphatidylglycerophosphate/ cardiolipin synthase n=1 Tax=Burkholderia ambifaria TaxID=152480 RepID=UPI002FE39D5B